MPEQLSQPEEPQPQNLEHSDVTADLEVAEPASQDHKEALLSLINTQLDGVTPDPVDGQRIKTLIDQDSGKMLAVANYPSGQIRDNLVGFVTVSEYVNANKPSTLVTDYVFYRSPDGVQVERLVSAQTESDEQPDWLALSDDQIEEMIREEEGKAEQAIKEEREAGLTQLNQKEAIELSDLLTRAKPRLEL